MKTPVACVLILILAVPAHARVETAQEQAGKIKLGAKIEVTLQSNEVIKGRRGPMSPTGFSIEPLKEGAGAAARAVEFNDVKQVRQTGLNTTEKALIITGVAVAAAVVTVVIWIKANTAHC